MELSELIIALSNATKIGNIDETVELPYFAVVELIRQYVDLILESSYYKNHSK